MRPSTALSLLFSPLLALAALENPFNVPPTGYPTLSAGASSLALTWTPTTSSTITLVLRSGSSTNLAAGTVIAANLPNSGAYTWTVPGDVVQGADYTVEIVDDSNNDNQNYTPYFVIDSAIKSAATTSVVTIGAPTAALVVPAAIQASPQTTDAGPQTTELSTTVAVITTQSTSTEVVATTASSSSSAASSSATRKANSLSSVAAVTTPGTLTTTTSSETSSSTSSSSSSSASSSSSSTTSSASAATTSATTSMSSMSSTTPTNVAASRAGTAISSAAASATSSLTSHNAAGRVAIDIGSLGLMGLGACVALWSWIS